MRFYPTLYSATRRREYRRAIRNALGASSEPSPESPRVFRAVASMQPLVSEATNGAFTLVLVNGRGQAVNPHVAYEANNENRVPTPAGAVIFSADEVQQIAESALSPGVFSPSVREKLGM